MLLANTNFVRDNIRFLEFRQSDHFFNKLTGSDIFLSSQSTISKVLMHTQTPEQTHTHTEAFDIPRVHHYTQLHLNTVLGMNNDAEV